MTYLLVPLDQSPLAEEALPWVAAIARPQSLPVHLLSVYRSGSDFWEYADLDPASRAVQATPSLPPYLEEIARSPVLAGLRVSTEVREGDVSEQILGVVERGDAEMVVICTRGRGGFEKLGIGSVADRLVRTVPVPILVVPPHIAVPARAEGVLVPLDGSASAEAALVPARKLANALEQTVHLLRIVDLSDDWRVSGSDQEILLEELTEHAERYVQRTAIAGEIPIAIRGRKVEMIRSYARANRCSMIVMATHGWSGPIRLELPSTTDAVVRTAERPVLVVRVPAGPDEDD